MMNTKWGTYPWFAEHGIHLIHPDDLEAFKQEVSNSKIFECVKEGDYITLRYHDNYYRVKKKLFKPVPSPKYVFGEKVKIKENGQEAVITDIMWHYDKKKHYYFVTINDKRKSRRYLDSEFT